MILNMLMRYTRPISITTLRLIKRSIQITIINNTSPFLFRSWQQLGVEVVVFSDDLSGETAVNALLSNAMRIGSIEGVYVTVGGKQQDIDETLLNTLDLVSRKLCTDIK